jgi:hypothetical protein
VQCALGVGELLGSVAFVSSEGQVACWDWVNGTVDVIDDHATENSSQHLVLLRCLDSGQILVSTLEQVALFPKHASVKRVDGHRREVTAVAIMRGRGIVSFSKADHSLVWHSGAPLAPTTKKTLPQPTAMTALPSTNDVVIAGDGGSIWVESSESHAPSRKHVGFFSLEPVIALCPAGEHVVAAATPSGTVTCVDTVNGDSTTVRLGNGALQQRELIAAGRCGVCWSNHLVTRALGIEPALSLLNSKGKDTMTLALDAKAASTCYDGTILAVADGEFVRVLERRLARFTLQLEKRVTASQLAFLGDTGLLGVARAEDHWLELWRVEADLPVVAAIELPSDPTCIAATADHIAVGFRSGTVLSLRPFGTARPQ